MSAVILAFPRRRPLAMKQARQTIELCDSLLAKEQTTLQTCLDTRKKYEERFGRRY